jgi:hypothetical protein
MTPREISGIRCALRNGVSRGFQDLRSALVASQLPHQGEFGPLLFVQFALPAAMDGDTSLPLRRVFSRVPLEAVAGVLRTPKSLRTAHKP